MNRLNSILLVDDDDSTNRFHEIIINQLGFKGAVQKAKNGKVALDRLQLEPEETFPEVIFLDLNMPRKSGIECLKEIRENKDFRNMAIAIYSTSSSEEDIEDTFVCGANIYIQKPNDYKELKKILSNVVTLNWQYHTNGLNKDNFLLRL